MLGKTPVYKLAVTSDEFVHFRTAIARFMAKVKGDMVTNWSKHGSWFVTFKNYGAHSKSVYVGDTNDMVYQRKQPSGPVIFRGLTASLSYQGINLAAYNYSQRMLWLLYGLEGYALHEPLNLMMSMLFSDDDYDYGGVRFDTVVKPSGEALGVCKLTLSEHTIPVALSDCRKRTHDYFGKALVLYDVELADDYYCSVKLEPTVRHTEQVNVSYPEYIDGSDAGLW